METAYVSVDGFDVAYWETGNGDITLFFVHGNASSKNSFARQMAPPLVDRFRLIAIDLPGHGLTRCAEGSTPDYSVHEFSQAICQAATTLGAEDAIFVGHSLGGHLLIQSMPVLSRARGLVLMGTPALSKPPEVERAFPPGPSGHVFLHKELSDSDIKTWARSSFAEAPHPSFVENARRADPRAREGIAHALGTMQYEDEPQILSRLSLAIAIFHGEHDLVVSRSYVEGLRVPKLWKGSVHIIEDAGHYAHLEHPELFNKVLTSFAEEATSHDAP